MLALTRILVFSQVVYFIFIHAIIAYIKIKLQIQDKKRLFMSNIYYIRPVIVWLKILMLKRKKWVNHTKSYYDNYITTLAGVTQLHYNRRFTELNFNCAQTYSNKQLNISMKLDPGMQRGSWSHSRSQGYQWYHTIYFILPKNKYYLLVNRCEV